MAVLFRGYRIIIRVSVVGYHIAKLLCCSPIPMSSSSGIVLGSDGGCFVIIGLASFYKDIHVLSWPPNSLFLHG